MKALVRILIAVLIFLLIVFPACNKIRGVFDSQKILVDENGVPLALGDPIGGGIYYYDPTGSPKPLWYKYEADEWWWTPYQTPTTYWMSVATIKVVDGEFDGEDAWDEHIDIIRLL